MQDSHSSSNSFLPGYRCTGSHSGSSSVPGCSSPTHRRRSSSSHFPAPEERSPYPEKTGGISPPRFPLRPCSSVCRLPAHGARCTVHFFLSVSLFCSSAQSSYIDRKKQDQDKGAARKSDLTGQIIPLPLA